MLTQLYANNAVTTLASSLGPSDTTIVVGSTAAFPTPGPNQFFVATIDSGTSVEVIHVYGKSATSFLNCVRARENTVAQTFQPGTSIECRPTRDTFSQLLRKQDRLFNIASVDSLEPPSNSDSNSYICSSTDDGGNPIIAYAGTTDTWRFVTHTDSVLSGAVGASNTTTSLNFAGASSTVSLPFPGKYIVQFTSGVNKGRARLVSGSSTTGISWDTALPTPATVGDTFEVYKSTVSIIAELLSSSEDGLIFPILFSD